MAGAAVGLAGAEDGALVAAGRAVGCACVVALVELAVAAGAGAFMPSTRLALAGAPPVPTMIVLRAGR